MTDINLLIHKDEESLGRKKRIQIAYFIAVMFLVGIGATSLVIFLLIQSTNLASIKKEQSDIKSKISQFQSKRIKLFLADNRINNIEEILKMRKDLGKIMSAILTKTPDRLLVEDLEINNTGIIMTLQSRSLSAVGEFVDGLIDMVRKKEIINSLTLNSLIFDESKNSYQISIKSDL